MTGRPNTIILTHILLILAAFLSRLKCICSAWHRDDRTLDIWTSCFTSCVSEQISLVNMGPKEKLKGKLQMASCDSDLCEIFAWSRRWCHGAIIVSPSLASCTGRLGLLCSLKACCLFLFGFISWTQTRVEHVESSSRAFHATDSFACVITRGWVWFFWLHIFVCICCRRHSALFGPLSSYRSDGGFTEEVKMVTTNLEVI